MEQTYIHWTLDFIHYDNRVHPGTLNQQTTTAYLEYLAIHRQIGTDTQRKALNALAYMYKLFLGRDDNWFKLDSFKRSS
ncbi:phage integrase N-terminal SAM-like domain-containing protein [Amphritea sp. ZJ14W]|nr:phage integrase N-terminal SAM-like domain-containing protein [Amphritea pacifica]